MTPVFVLSDDLLINTPQVGLNILFTRFLISNVSDSILYKEAITSFKYIVAQFDQDENKLHTELTLALNQYLERYYPNNIITIKLEIDIEDNNLIYVDFDIKIKDKNSDTLIATIDTNIKYSKIEQKLIGIESVMLSEYTHKDANISIF
jgi:hypothetical protein